MADGHRRHRRRHDRRDAEEARWMDMMQVMRDQNDLLRAQNAATNQMMQQFLQQQQQQYVPPPPPPPPEQPAVQPPDPHSIFLKFHKLNPPSFPGSEDAMEAQHWLEAMERIFKVVPCTDEQKVTFVTHYLTEGAAHWWEGARTYLEEEEEQIGWEEFKGAFLEKYFPQTVKDRKDREFTHFKQGDLSMAEYVRKFEELARFSSHAEYAPDEKWKINQFMWGLRADIQNNLSQTEFYTFASLIRKSYKAEESLKKMYDERQLQWHKRKDEGKLSQPFKGKGSKDKGKQIQHSETPKQKECLKCGKAHKGECNSGNVICFYCRQPGHFIKDCPKLKAREASKSDDLLQGRVHTLSGKKAKGVENLMNDKQEPKGGQTS